MTIHPTRARHRNVRSSSLTVRGSPDLTVAAASPTKRKSTPVPAVSGSSSDSGKSHAFPLHVRYNFIALMPRLGTTPSSPERHSPKPKRRKMVIGDDDGDDGPAPSSRELYFVRSFLFWRKCEGALHTEAPSSRAASSSPPPPPPPRDEKQKKIKVESSSKAKVKGKAKAAAAVVEKEDVDMDGGERAAAGESEPDSGEEDAEERKAASKRCVCAVVRLEHN